MTALARSTRLIRHGRALIAAMAAATTALAGPALADPASPAPEESDTHSIPVPQHNWFYVQRGFLLPATSIYDGDTGQLIGAVETPILGDLAIDPAGKHYYVAETAWTRRLHGTRQDYVSVYDSATLKFEGDIDIPGRILVGARSHDFVLSNDGKTGYVYNFSPVSSVNVLDMVKRKFVRSFELPGCADLIPNPGVGLAALCSDGSMAVVNLTGAKEDITRTDPFFEATGDPIFDNLAIDKAKNEAVMLTYSGLVHIARLGAKITLAPPFSLQEAAGLRKGSTAPLEVNWYPGGNQPMALHAASGHLFVLMHTGEYWSHKAGGSEIWDLDLAARKVVKRIPIEGEPGVIAVTQTAQPKLMVLGEGVAGGESHGGGAGVPGPATIIDPKTGAKLHEIPGAGYGLVQVVD